MKYIGLWLLKKPLHSAVVAFALSILSVIGLSLLSAILVSVVVAFITLCRGVKAGAIVLSWGILPYAALLLVRDVGLMDYALFLAIVSWALVAFYLQYRSWSLVVECLTLLGLLTIVAVHLLVPDLQAHWQHFFTARFSELKQMDADLPANMGQSFIALLAPIATGLMTLMTMYLIMLVMVYAQRWQAQIQSKSQDQYGFLNIRVGFITLVIAVIIFLFGMLHYPLAVDCQQAVMFPFVIAGLSVIHYYMQGYRYGVLVLCFMYIGFILMGWMMLLIAIVGFMDVVFNFRKRFLRKS